MGKSKKAQRWSSKLEDLVHAREKTKDDGVKAEIQKQINAEYKRLGMDKNGRVKQNGIRLPAKVDNGTRIVERARKHAAQTKEKVADDTYRNARKAGVKPAKAAKLADTAGRTTKYGKKMAERKKKIKAKAAEWAKPFDKFNKKAKAAGLLDTTEKKAVKATKPKTKAKATAKAKTTKKRSKK